MEYEKPVKFILLVSDDVDEDNDTVFGRATIENAGHRAEPFRLNGYFTDDLDVDLRRFAAECRVSEQQLNSEFNAMNQRQYEAEDGTWEKREQTFEDFCWDYVVRVLVRDVAKLDDIWCVVGTNSRAVHYLADHLRITNGRAMAIVPASRRKTA